MLKTMRFMLAAIAVLLISACGVATRQPIAPDPSPPASPMHGFDVLVTDRDQAVTVHEGQKIEVYLVQRHGMNPWGQVTVDDSSVLQAVPTGITAPRGVTLAGFVALKPGVATITSYAGPLCSPGQACPMYVMLYSVRVTVTG